MMDYVCVGSNGFAQLGSENYWKKSHIEMNFLLELFREKFPVPEQLKTLCRFAAKSFNHDFGVYREIVVLYDTDAIMQGYEERNEGKLMTEEEFQAALVAGLIAPEPEEPLLYDVFWNWFNEVESFDIESEAITRKLKALYDAALDKGIGEHLIILRNAI